MSKKIGIVTCENMDSLMKAMDNMTEVMKVKAIEQGISLEDSLEAIRQLSLETKRKPIKVYLSEFQRQGKTVLCKRGESTRYLPYCRDKEVIVMCKGNLSRKYYKPKRLLIPVETVTHIIYDEFDYRRIEKGCVLELLPK